MLYITYSYSHSVSFHLQASVQMCLGGEKSNKVSVTAINEIRNGTTLRGVPRIFEIFETYYSRIFSFAWLRGMRRVARKTNKQKNTLLLKCTKKKTIFFLRRTRNFLLLIISTEIQAWAPNIARYGTRE